MARTKREEAPMCRMDGCDRHVECQGSGLCKRCYAWVRYQIKNSVTKRHLVERLEKYKFWDKRLSGYISRK